MFNNFAYKIFAILVGLAIAIVLAEVVLRLFGIQPYQQQQYKVDLDPPGNLFEQQDSLGFQIAPGKYVLTLPSGFSFHITQNEDGSRAATYNEKNDSLVQIWLLGGSYLFGWSVNDESSAAWLVQKKLQAFSVKNFAQPGYGTLQSYLQLKRQLKKATPHKVIYAYAPFHTERNVASRYWFKQLAPYNHLGDLSLPVASLDDSSKLSIRYVKLNYPVFPLIDKMATVHFLEKYYNQWELDQLHSQLITERLIESMNELCQKNQVPFIVAAIVEDDGLEVIQDFCKQKNIPFHNISVDTRKPKFTNLPDDSHPSAEAHKVYAEKLLKILQ